MPVLNLDIPVATITQSLPDPSATSEPSKDWNADPALDKENQTNVVGFPIQNLRAPVITVEKKPELLAKDLIKVAISFQNRHRMATALSVFKRAYHMLPKKSTKLVERLMYLEREHPIAVGQVPSQDMSTTAYMVKVLECDLMAVLNYGTIKELTELHAIGAKRAEFVLDKRPYHQLEELQRVPGISYAKISMAMAWQLQEQEEARRLRALLQQQQQEEEETRTLRVGLRQHGAPRWEDVRTDASFVERSRRRKPGAMKAQERYLRRDIHCGVASCSACRQARALVPPHVLPRVHNGEYVVPDAFSLLQCMELLEEEALFCRAAPRLLVLESVLQAALRLAPSRDASRLRKFFRGEDQRTGGGVSVFLFPDQHHIDTFVEPTAMDELQAVRDDRAVLKAVEWYVTQGHLPPQAKVVFMTRDVDASVSIQLAAVVNAQAVTCETFLMKRLPQHSENTAFLLELAANTAEAVRYEESQRLPDENGNVIGSQSEFVPHLKPAQLEEALAQQSSRFLAGKLEVSTHNPMEAYVLVEGPQAVEKVFVFGRAAMNRGVHGDRVAVEMLPKAHWRAPQSDRLLVHYTQDEEREHESESVDETDEQEPGAIPTGQVVGILSRSPRYHVATVIASTVNAGDDYALAVPMDQRLPKVRIRSQRLDALLDKRLKVVIDSWASDSSYPNGHYVGILGAPGSLQTELSALLVDNEVEEAPFSEAALACLPSSDECPIDIEGDCVAECSTAKRPTRCGLLNWNIPEEEVPRRRDLRKTHRIFSVDPHGCQDIDDAMSIRRLSNGNVELGVHIADVSYFVEHGSALDLEGRRRGTTVYLVGQRLDMLPSVLSADLCSLHENRDRFAVSVMWELNGETYDVVEGSTWFGRTIIRNCSSMTYEQAHRLLQGVNADVDDAPRLGLARSQPHKDVHAEGVAGGRIPLRLQQEIREDLRIITDVGRRLSRTRGSQGGLDLSKQEELVQLAKARDVVIDATNNFTLQQSLAAAERSGRMDSKTMSLLKSLAVRVMTEAEYKNRQAKLAAHACDALFLALYFSSHTVKVPAIITALKQNGFIVYVPKYDLRAPVYLRDKSGVVQMDPLLLGVRIVDTNPATGAFAGAECIRRIHQAQLIWDDTDRETLQVVAPEDKRTVFHILDEVEVQVSCDLTASGARIPQLQLLLVGRASSTRKKHIASSLSELQRVVQTKSEADNDPISKKADVSEPSTAQQFSSSLYDLLLNGPNLSPSKSLARRKPEEEGKKPGFKRRGPGRLVFGHFSTNSRRHYQHKLAQYMDERSEAREEELKIQRFANGSAMTTAQEARRAEREALSRTQKLAAEKRHDRINRRNKVSK
ncbi:Non-canonical poly(A) RNA polymerase [Phytophthora nicotianae]|uniref:DIS3-like exonuclease 1 n=1 Tax=Phytophthora nicotianae TaxID=4792 RepID=A0A0W8DLM0_PHYNI|nr:Non-canonical poly(A) RNA polymerase [Phytophthora nicotianae]